MNSEPMLIFFVFIFIFSAIPMARDRLALKVLVLIVLHTSHTIKVFVFNPIDVIQKNQRQMLYYHRISKAAERERFVFMLIFYFCCVYRFQSYSMFNLSVCCTKEKTLNLISKNQQKPINVVHCQMYAPIYC